MTSPRLDAFRAMLAKNPANALAHFGLASEAAKAGLHAEAVEHLRAYLELHEDEGNAYGRLADSLLALDRVDEAKESLRKGIDAATRFAHPGMASEFEMKLEELE